MLQQWPSRIEFGHTCTRVMENEIKKGLSYNANEQSVFCFVTMFKQMLPNFGEASCKCDSLALIMV